MQGFVRFWNSTRNAAVAFLDFAHGGLLMAGLIGITVLSAHLGRQGEPGFGLPFSGLMSAAFGATRVGPVAPAEPVAIPEPDAVTRFLAQRYRVSGTALAPLVRTANQSGRELGIDPLLILAVIGVESGFNPLSESAMGAQGLMQVIPRWHADKLENAADANALFDPETNIRIGAQVLKESIRRSGSLVDGLQQYGGAPNAELPQYANKVLALRQRLAEVRGRRDATDRQTGMS